jgi:hypothetical protein
METNRTLRGIFVFIIFIYSCNSSNVSPEEEAKFYCECMNENLKEMDFLESRSICDARLIEKVFYSEKCILKITKDGI